MSAAAEFTVFLVGGDVLADRALQRHLAKQYVVHSAKKAADIDKLMLKRALESRELSRIHRTSAAS